MSSPKDIAGQLSEADATFTDGEAHYDPPTTGLHLCGHAVCPDDKTHYEQAHTAAVWPMQAERARELFTVAKAAGECSKEEQDFIFDLFIDSDHVDDFYTSRQQMHNVRAAVRNHIIAGED